MSSRADRRGFSLLEVMLATIILLGAIVVLGELARIGSRNVQAACAETEAERIAQSVLGRIVAAGAPPELVRNAPIETSPGWLYSIESEPLDRPGLSAVRVTVSQDLPEEKQPVEYTVVRWLRIAPEEEGIIADRSLSPHPEGSSFDQLPARSEP
jgi:prepilin-type N-terminal cleavage/methylation domain-containing protein